MKKIRKAVIPCGGLGTRILPATKAQAKEMLPIVDKPALQYLVEELVASGIKEILIITGRNKETIENHFDYSYELETMLKEKNKTDLLNKVEDISGLANIYFIRQKKPIGLGHAVLKSESFVGDEPFLVLLGDDIMYSDIPVCKQLIDVYEKEQVSTILGVQEVSRDTVDKYGIISIEEKLNDKLYKVNDFIEKPNINEAPSNIAALGRYVLSPNIFEYIKMLNPGKQGEIQLTDAILNMIKDGYTTYAYSFDAKRYDIGDKYGMFKANVEYGLRHPEIKDKAKKYLKDLIENL